MGKSFVLGSKIVLKPTQHQSEIEVEVDGQIVRLNRNERKQVESQNKKVTYTLHRTSDEFVVVETPYMRIITNGHIVEVENTHMVPVELAMDTDVKILSMLNPALLSPSKLLLCPSELRTNLAPPSLAINNNFNNRRLSVTRS